MYRNLGVFVRYCGSVNYMHRAVISLFTRHGLALPLVSAVVVYSVESLLSQYPLVFWRALLCRYRPPAVECRLSK